MSSSLPRQILPCITRTPRGAARRQDRGSDLGVRGRQARLVGNLVATGRLVVRLHFVVLVHGVLVDRVPGVVVRFVARVLVVVLLGLIGKVRQHPPDGLLDE